MRWIVFLIQLCSTWLGTGICLGCYELVDCCGESATICPAIRLLFSRTEWGIHHRFSFLTCVLIVWPRGKNLVVDDDTSKYVINMTLTVSIFLVLLILETSTHYSWTWFVVCTKNPCLITSDGSALQTWFSLKTLNDVLTHLHVALFLIIIQQSRHQFCTDFLQGVSSQCSG